jgi:hypothetical protein
VLQPHAPLAAGTTYTARLAGVADMAGNELADAVSWNFTTAGGSIQLQNKLMLPVILR